MTEKRCSKRLYGPGSTFKGHPCPKAARVTVDGLNYCGIHSPAAVERRRKKSEARRERVWAGMQRSSDISQGEGALLEETLGAFKAGRREFTPEMVAAAERLLKLLEA